MPRSFDAIDHVLALDLNGRGVASFFTPGAVRASARALRGARRVLITTGFCVGPNLPETDGPPGAAVLGRALRLSGARVRYVVDRTTVAPLEAALKTLREPADLVVYPEGAGAAAGVLRRERPTHLVAVERPGRNLRGDYLDARGGSVAAWNAPLDALFLQRSRATTVAVGDGGNEIGMGKVRRRVARQGRLAARIASVVPVDHLVVAGTSNWGAYGLAAALGALTGRALLHTPALERRMIEACVEAGAVDGLTRRSEPTVDGLPLAVHEAVVELLGIAAAPRPPISPPSGRLPVSLSGSAGRRATRAGEAS